MKDRRANCQRNAAGRRTSSLTLTDHASVEAIYIYFFLLHVIKNELQSFIVKVHSVYSIRQRFQQTIKIAVIISCSFYSAKKEQSHCHTRWSPAFISDVCLTRSAGWPSDDLTRLIIYHHTIIASASSINRRAPGTSCFSCHPAGRSLCPKCHTFEPIIAVKFTRLLQSHSRRRTISPNYSLIIILTAKLNKFFLAQSGLS